MSVLTLRCAAAAATLLAVSACSGGSSFPAGSQGTAQADSRAHRQPGALGVPFVHAGVPFVPARFAPPHLGLPAIATTYPTNELLLLEGDSTNEDIQIYDAKDVKKNPAPLATITDGIQCPYGMAFDKKGTLYVANNCGANTVTEYPKGQTTHSAELTNGISNPLGVAIDSKGTVYVANYVANSPATIQEYAAGSTSPTLTITSPDLVDPFGLALDDKDNLYIADFGSSGVYEVPFGTSTVVALGLQDLTEPLNLAFDKAGNLWVTDGEGDKVNVYAPNSTTPIESITSGYSFPYQIASDKKGTVFTSNQSSSPEVYGYKAGKYSPYATLTNDIKLTTGLLLGKP